MARVQPLWAAITTDLVDCLLRYARRRLLVEMGLPAGDPVEVPDSDGPFERVQVLLTCQGELRASGAATGGTLAEAVARAVCRLSRDSSQAALLIAGEVGQGVLEVLIQTGSRRIASRSVGRVRKRYSPGLMGLELRQGKTSAWFDPTVAVRRGWGIEETLVELSRAAGLAEDAWSDDDTELLRTDWLHFAEGPGGAIELLRGRLRVRQRPTASSIDRAILDCTRRLAGSQRSDGGYTYTADARTGALSNADFNTVRMCGSTYAMTRVVDHVPPGRDRQAFIRNADRAVRFVLDRRTEVASVPGAWFVGDRRRGRRRQYGKLGASALALFSLQFGPFTGRFAAERAALTDAILSLQDADGRFRVHFYGLEYDGKPKPERSSAQNYFPGEALIALFHEWRHSGDARVLRAIRRAFPIYRDHFRREPDTAFLLWQVDVWRSMAEHFLARPDAAIPDAPGPGEVAEYVELVFEQVDWLLVKQYTPLDAPAEDFIGGFFNTSSAPGSVTGVVTEPIIRALGLAARVGDKARVERYREAARQGLIFLFRLVLKPEEAYQLRRPNLALGGVTHSLTSFALRNDVDQHAMTCWIAARETPALDL